MALVWGANKYGGLIARGTAGVITYHLGDRNSTLAIMWSVPFDYNIYSNWWNIKIYDGHRDANKDGRFFFFFFPESTFSVYLFLFFVHYFYKDIFNEMYYASYASAIPGDSTEKTGSLNGIWNYEGGMANSGITILNIRLYNYDCMPNMS